VRWNSQGQCGLQSVTRERRPAQQAAGLRCNTLTGHQQARLSTSAVIVQKSPQCNPALVLKCHKSKGAKSAGPRLYPHTHPTGEVDFFLNAI
jgi:hypothetical protein